MLLLRSVLAFVFPYNSYPRTKSGHLCFVLNKDQFLSSVNFLKDTDLEDISSSYYHNLKLLVT